MACKAGRFRGDTLHQIPITGEHPRAVIDERARVAVLVEACREQPFRQCHADRIADPLSQRAGRRLDTRGLAVLGMSGSGAVQLTEVAQVVQAQVVSGQMQHGVLQHARVTA